MSDKELLSEYKLVLNMIETMLNQGSIDLKKQEVSTAQVNHWIKSKICFVSGNRIFLVKKHRKLLELAKGSIESDLQKTAEKIQVQESKVSAMNIVFLINHLFGNCNIKQRFAGYNEHFAGKTINHAWYPVLDETEFADILSAYSNLPKQEPEPVNDRAQRIEDGFRKLRYSEQCITGFTKQEKKDNCPNDVSVCMENLSIGLRQLDVNIIFEIQDTTGTKKQQKSTAANADVKKAALIHVADLLMFLSIRGTPEDVLELYNTTFAGKVIGDLIFPEIDLGTLQWFLWNPKHFFVHESYVKRIRLRKALIPYCHGDATDEELDKLHKECFPYF